MVNLITLAKVAPITEDLKKEILEKAASFPSAKTMEMEEYLWEIISADYQSRIDIEKQKYLTEVESGNRKYSKDEFEKIDNNFYQELAKKLNAADDSEKIDQIRQKLTNPSS